MRTVLTAVSTAILVSTLSAPAQVRELKLTPENVHWDTYDARLKPVMRIASGETIRVETMLYGLQQARLAGVTEAEIPDSLKAVDSAPSHKGPGGAPLTGPIYVEGAEPGDVLEIRILAYEFLHNFGWTGFQPGRGTLMHEFPYAHFKLIRFDPQAGTADFAPGISLQLAPFWGKIGVAPPVTLGAVASGAPGPHGGNFDNKELTPGAVLYLPVQVPGALLSFADGHAMQGDGEVSVAAVETSLRGTAQIFLRKGKRLLWPRMETPSHYISMGLDPDLDEAARRAVRDMVDFLVAEKKMTRQDAYLLCSVAADLRVTQNVDGVKGIHAMLPKAVFK